MSLVRDSDGHLEIFGSDFNDGIWQRVESPAESDSWGNWAQFSATAKLRALATEVNPNGELEMFGVTVAGDIYRRRQTGNTGWGNFVFLGHVNARSVTMARNADGHLEAFTTTAGGFIAQSFQTAPGSTTWTAWNYSFGMPGVFAIDVAAQTNQDGRVEAFMLSNSGTILHRWQLVGGGWSNWVSMNSPIMMFNNTTAATVRLTKLAVAPAGGGQLMLFALDHDRQVWVRSQTSPNVTTESGWGSWTRLDGRMSQITARPTNTGVVQLVGVDHEGQIWRRRQQSATISATWTAWSAFTTQKLRADVPATATFTPRSARVPNLIDLTEDDAMEILQASGLLAGTITRSATTAPAGEVIGQSETPNQQVPLGTAVDFTVSLGGSIVPDIVGDFTSVAGQKIVAAGLIVGIVGQVDAGLPWGTVVDQFPAPNVLLAPGSRVDYDMANGQG